MRAVQFAAYGNPDVLDMVELPLPEPRPGEIRIKVKAIGVNPADFKWRSGMFAELVPLQLPHVLGYDIAGTVDALGDDISDFAVGDRVFAMLDNIGKGGYAEFAVCMGTHVARMPAGLSFEAAAALPTPALTGFQIIEEQLQPESGQTVLITGATGAAGRFAIYAARRSGARVVAAVRASQQDEARKLGANETFVLGGQAWKGQFDHIADTVGGAAVAALCHQLNPGGHIRTISTTPIDPTGLPAEPVFFPVRPDQKKLEEIGKLVAASEIKMPIALRLPLSQAVEAHRLAEKGGLGGKLILTPHEDAI